MSDELVKYLIKRIDHLEVKVDKVLQFKWQIIGGGMGISVVITLGFQILNKLL